MRKLSIIYVLLLHMFYVEMVAQDLPIIIPNSPEATEFMKYGNTNINLYTGIPEIAIPIYTIQGKEFNMPISLNYDAGGIQVNQIATQIGLSWSLQAGGMVSRIVNGKPDHTIGGAWYVGSYYSHYEMLKAFYETNINESQIYQPINPLYFPTLSSYFFFEQNTIANGGYDTQPDYFSFSVGDISGTIYIDPITGKAICNNGKNYKITYGGSLGNFSGGGITSWKIIDEKGNQYFFDLYDTTRNFEEGQNKTYISSWQLTKIISPNGIDTVNFLYTLNDYWQDEKYVPAGLSTNSNLLSDSPLLSSCPQEISNWNSNTNPYSISQHYLSSITLNNKNVINFIPSLQERLDLSSRFALDKIVIANGIEWKFYHSYFKSNPNIDLNNITAITEDHIRLKLDSIVMKPNSTSIGQQNYTFNYFNPNYVPYLQSFSQDYWGFFNGAPNNSSYGLIPQETVLVNGTSQYFPGANRSPNIEYAKNGTLASIIYPTGGHTEFEYELNSLNSTNDGAIQNNNISLGNLVGGNDLANPYDYYDDEYFFDTPKGKEFIIPVYETGPKDIKISYFSPSLPYAPGDNDDGVLFVAILKCNGGIPDRCNPKGQLLNSNCPLGLDWEDIIYYDISKRKLVKTYKGGSGTGALPNGYTETIPLNLEEGFYKLYILNGVTNSNLAVSMHYSSIENQISEKPIGGLRIKSIKDFDINPSVPILTKKYSYKATVYDDCGKPFSGSSGVLHFNPKFSYISYYDRKTVVNGNLAINNCTYLERFSHPVNSARSPHVAYSTVTEEYYDNNNQNNGSTEYHFYNDKEGYNENLNPPFLKTNFINGNIKEILTFDKSNALLQRTTKTYKQIQIENSIQGFITSLGRYKVDDQLGIIPVSGGNQIYKILQPVVQYQGLLAYPNPGGNAPTMTYGPPIYSSKSNVKYLISNNYSYLEETATINYFGTDSLVTRTNYYYDGLTQSPKTHRQVSRTKTTTSDGESMLTKTYYPDDITSITSLGFDPLSINEKAAIDNLKTLNRKAVPIQNTTYRDLNLNGIGDINEILSNQRTNFKGFGGNKILPEYIQSSKGANALEDRVQFLGYDENGNVKEVSKTDGTHITYVWGYNGQYPIAKIENATFSQVSGQVSALQTASNADNDRTIGASGNEGALRTALTALRDSLPNSLVATYTYDPLIGVTSFTDPKGYTIYYEYDSLNRLKRVKDASGKILSENEYNYKQ